MPVLTQQQVKEHAECLKLRTKRDDVKGKKGYREFHRKAVNGKVVEVPGPAPDGYYEWAYKFKSNDGGKLTHAAHDHLERNRPFMVADTERYSRFQAKLPRVTMKDKDGGVRFVDPARAGEAARNLGWSHKPSVGGTRIVSGPDGMNFRHIGGRWEPTGRWCSGTPYDFVAHPAYGNRDGTMKHKGIQRDPDGNPWFWLDGEWRRCGD